MCEFLAAFMVKTRNIYKAKLGSLYVTFACRENKKRTGKNVTPA